jgi:hypothetical protein
MNCWGIRIYFTKSRFSLNGGYIVCMELLSGHEKNHHYIRDFTKCGNIKSGFYCTLCVSALCLTFSYTLPTSTFFYMFQLFEALSVSRFMNLMPCYDCVLNVIPLLFMFFDICYNSLHIRIS